MQKEFDVLVIGAGINGLSTAYHLSLQTGLKVGIVEQFSVGHAFGGSHGASRIIRSTYAHPGYIRLMKRVQEYEWPLLEKEAGCKLIHPNPGCFYGYGNSFEKYIQSIVNCGLNIEILEVDAARRMFPQFRFPNASAVLRDLTGGVIAAGETIGRLASMIVRNGVKLYEGTRVLNVDSSGHPIKVSTDKGDILAERLVIATGAWTKQLVPVVEPIRQTVGYFKLRGPWNDYQIGRFPNWAFIGDSQVFYGLPEFGSEGIKVSQHVTAGKSDDPEVRVTTADLKQLDILEEFIQGHFVDPIEKLVHAETCFYANTPTEDFIIDLLPKDERIAVGLVCSGHGFKFAPLTGRILSELILHGRTTVPEFEEVRELFSMRAVLDGAGVRVEEEIS